jgi:hypothetical protein
MDYTRQISATEAATTAKAKQVSLAKQITKLSTAVKALQGHGTVDRLQAELSACKAEAVALAKYLTKLADLRNALKSASAACDVLNATATTPAPGQAHRLEGESLALAALDRAASEAA